MTEDETEAWGQRCRAFVASQPGDAAHDLGHLGRVVAQARRLAEAEGADPAVVVPAAWLHDCVTVPKDSPDRSRASQLAAETAGRWLRAEGYPAALVPAIEHAVAAHSWSAGVAPETREAEVVQDADRLDALGAIGVARLYATAAGLGSALVHPVDATGASGRALDDRRWATDHVAVKLLGLPATMRTEAGRAEAERRAAFLLAFVEQLRSEVEPGSGPGAAGAQAALRG